MTETIASVLAANTERSAPQTQNIVNKDERVPAFANLLRFNRLKLIQAMVSVLGSNTDGSAPQSSLDRINMGLPSSLDSLPGKSEHIEKN